MLCATANTTFALDGLRQQRHSWGMRTAVEILAELRERGVTQTAMGKVLGIQQPNVATFYTPGRNGKLRQLGYDEAIALMKAFELEKDAASPSEPAAPVPSEDELATMIQIAMRELPVGVSFEDYPQAVSSSLHAQLRQYQAAGGFRREDAGNAPDTDAPPPKPTKPRGQAKPRNP
jgi:predicted XRE-type DNA-binding protein